MAETETETKPPVGSTTAPAADAFEPFTMPEIPGVQWLTDEEAHAIFDEEARQVMGMSGEEFLRRFDAGEYDNHPDTSAKEDLDFWRLVMSIPFGR